MGDIVGHEDRQTERYTLSLGGGEVTIGPCKLGSG